MSGTFRHQYCYRPLRRGHLCGRAPEGSRRGFTSIVLGELYFGVRKSGRIRQNLKRIDELAISSAVLACDLGTAREYGEIKGALQEKGRPNIEVW